MEKILLALLLSAFLLSGCGAKDSGSSLPTETNQPSGNTSNSVRTEEPKRDDEPQQAEKPNQPEQSEPVQVEQSESARNDSFPAQSTQPVQSVVQDSQMEAYVAALNGFYYNHIYPNGDTLPPSADGDYSDLDLNQFAVYDIDCDGEDELLFLYSNTDFAKMQLIVYRYDTDFPGSLMVELVETPDTTFYDNGMVQTAASNGEETDTYLFYSYSPISDTYEYIASVVSWDKTLSPDGFPDETDTDGDGIIYRHYVGTNAQIIDGPAYQDLLNSWIGDANPIKVPYQAFTSENIAALQ